MRMPDLFLKLLNFDDEARPFGRLETAHFSQNFTG
jgi:hypothetical protein